MTEKNDEMEIAQKNRAMSMMFLLFEEECEMPSDKDIVEKLKQKGYETNAEWESNDKSIRLFYLPQYTVDFSDAKDIPYQLSMFSISKTEKPHGDATARTQFWKTPNGTELLDNCTWQVMIGDFISSNHLPKIRAQILSDWLDIALELFPTCKGVWFEGSKNVMTAEALRENPFQGINKIFYGALNARFFRVGESNDFIVDTIGMHVFGLPDVQFHFHTLNPNNIVSWAYDVALYQFENDVPIGHGETVGGFDEQGNVQENIRWKCNYEMSIIEPQREVLDVHTQNFASGNRESEELLN